MYVRLEVTDNTIHYILSKGINTTINSSLLTWVAANMAMKDLPDMYAQSPRAAGLRAEGIHIRQITNGHVTSIMYHFVPIVTTPVVFIPQVIVTLVRKVISTNC